MFRLALSIGVTVMLVSMGWVLVGSTNWMFESTVSIGLIVSTFVLGYVGLTSVVMAPYAKFEVT